MDVQISFEKTAVLKTSSRWQGVGGGKTEIKWIELDVSEKKFFIKDQEDEKNECEPANQKRPSSPTTTVTSRMSHDEQESCDRETRNRRMKDN